MKKPSIVTAFFSTPEQLAAFKNGFVYDLASIEPNLYVRQDEMRKRMLEAQQKEKRDSDQRRVQAFADSGPDCRAALIILTSSMFNRDGRVWRYVDVDAGRIQFKKILRDYTFSGGQRRMLRVAASLFNQEFNVNLFRDLAGLDDYNTTIVLKAIHAYCRRRYAE
jgi:hypothetical protein